MDPPKGEQVAEALRTLYLRSSRLLDRRLARHGTSLARAKVLFLLIRGPLRSADVAASFGFAPRTVTEAIDGLERDGLVRRTPDPDDRRAKRISLTDAGTAIAHEAQEARRVFCRDAFEVLEDEEIRTLNALLGRINQRLGELDDQG